MVSSFLFFLINLFFKFLSVNIWSVGCIFGEMIRMGNLFFQAKAIRLLKVCIDIEKMFVKQNPK